MDAAEEHKMREAIKVTFNDPAKVNDMPLRKVLAIYLRLKAQGKVT